jgi:hypothetical protein
MWHRGYLKRWMRNDRHELSGPENATRKCPNGSRTSQLLTRRHGDCGATDSLLQNSRRLEYDYATRRNRHLGAGLRVTADTLTFLEISCHGFVSLQFQNPITAKCASRRRNASLVHASVYKNLSLFLLPCTGIPRRVKSARKCSSVILERVYP